MGKVTGLGIAPVQGKGRGGTVANLTVFNAVKQGPVVQFQAVQGSLHQEMIPKVFGLKGNFLGGPLFPTQSTDGQAQAFVERAGPVEVALNLLGLQGVAYLEEGEVVPEIPDPAVGPKRNILTS